ncbi:MAG: hypothetical protein ACJ73D_14260 [Pyrinomonadaceae bacterium]
MGLDVNGIKFVLYAAGHGVSFAETAMIGRQSVLASAEEVARSCELFGHQISADKARELIDDSDGYAESLLRFLGATVVTSFDASDYEGASVVHDLNEPIGDEWKGRFSAVLDGGCLEHVFNYPTALKSCMEMVRLGGHYLAITPCNNFFGHGFYQFSPELFYRAFSEANGYRVEKLMLHETASDGEWFEVADPATIGERITLVNSEPAHLLLIAKRIAEVPIFQKAPQQSDYMAAWENERASTAPPQLTFAEKAWKKVQRFTNRRLGELYTKKRYFKKVQLP